MSRSGDRNATSFIILQGYVVGMGMQCKINSPTTGIFPIRWKNNRLPDGVKIGSYVTIIGKLITFDLGRAFLVIGAEALKPKQLPKIKKFLEECKNEKPHDSGKV